MELTNWLTEVSYKTTQGLLKKVLLKHHPNLKAIKSENHKLLQFVQIHNFIQENGKYCDMI